MPTAVDSSVLLDVLLARDRGYYRDYFQKLNLRDPSLKK
jgi:hypothetical protein